MKTPSKMNFQTYFKVGDFVKIKRLPRKLSKLTIGNIYFIIKCSENKILIRNDQNRLCWYLKSEEMFDSTGVSIQDKIEERFQKRCKQLLELSRKGLNGELTQTERENTIYKIQQFLKSA